MRKAKRVFLIVLDSLGIGAADDAALFGDTGANTLESVVRDGGARLPSLCALGIGCIDGVTAVPAVSAPLGKVARLREKSCGKDTTVGHFEFMGIVTDKPFPTYPDGFPRELVKRVEEAIGIGTLCALPYSGTDVIRDFGEEHMKSGKPIIYTSADSVFQIAAHESVIPRDRLYEYCRTVRGLLSGDDGVARVIARPFTGNVGGFVRTDGRHDFSLPPPTPNTMTRLCERGLSVIAVGKINDIFSSVGITEAIATADNTDGMAKTMQQLKRDFTGLCFVNLVDFDMLYGHRQDAEGYARALEEFDRFLPSFMESMREDDLLLITADHGCDPSDNSTDHTREDVPLLIYSRGIQPEDLGVITGLDTVGELIEEALL